MNNTYHAPDLQQNVTQSKLQQSPQGMSPSSPYSYLQQSHPQLLHQHHSHHQLLPQNALLVNGTRTTTGALYGIDKSSYYTTATAAGNPTTHPNTILITNNFAQQQHPKQQTSHSGVFKGSNIRIISAPNVYNITRSNKVDNHVFDAETTSQHVSDIMSATYAAQQFAAPALQSYFLPTNADPLTVGDGTSTSNLNCTATNTAKVLTQANEVATVMPNGKIGTTSIFDSNLNNNALLSTSTNNNNNSSTVVLDRINICINNHYNESVPNSCSPVASAICAMPAQQPSPIIPAIQHRPIIESCIIGTQHTNFVDSSNNSGNSISSSSDIVNPSTVIVIDEPDSTTMPQNTPPTTPENTSPHKSSTEQSPSSTTNIQIISNVNVKNQQSKPCFALEEHTVNDLTDVPEIKCSTTTTPPQTDSSGVDETICETLLQLKEPTRFTLEEDVFIKRQDGRFYLGTIISCGDKRYLVRFDDKSEQWCEIDEMRKFGGNQESASTEQNAMCVACKRTQSTDIVEICERCGRGYHRSCTTETLIGSGVWQCKRCAKPMKLVDPPKIQRKRPADICRRLPYHLDKLNWDEKHRINEEQIYCYCGGSGSFDYNMLQCCKCRNWFHTECMQQFKTKILRGDSFFVFCCTVCNDGSEFIRRLQIEWVDVLHLTLYNLRKQHGQKYQHIIKDIWPFILENRNLLPICREWRCLPETSLMERIKQTLNEETTRFICGREKRRGNSYYGLRYNLPPVTPNIAIEMDEQLTDSLLTEKLNLTLLPDAPENESSIYNLKQNISPIRNDQDVYEFRIDDEETSEDEIPIIRIIDNAKKQKLSTSLEVKTNQLDSQSTLDVADDNANDAICQVMQLKKSPQKSGSVLTPKTELNTLDKSNLILSKESAVATIQLKSSRKRKEFRLSKSYKEIAAKAYDSSRMCDLSSDENSSSSRGTSLDLIIPPPANFLGSNNPFLMVTPKKESNSSKLSLLGRNTGGVKNSIFNTSTLDFSSKLSHLKSAGIFPNISTNHLAKAAGQPRTVRTVKRRLSAKDITIGPNQEVRRRRTRRLNSHVEVISTTTINPIPNNFYPIYAKDCSTATTVNKLQPPSAAVFSTSSNMEIFGVDNAATRFPPRSIKKETQMQKYTHGRLLRQRPQKSNISPGNSRRSSTSSNQSVTNNNNNNNSSVTNTSNDSDNSATANNKTIHDLKKTVNIYFGGAVNRIEAGEPYAIRAKRRLTNGQLQYLIEWGETLLTNNIVSQ